VHTQHGSSLHYLYRPQICCASVLLCFCASVHILHTYTHTYIHTYIHTHINTHINTHIHTRIHTLTHTHIHKYIHSYIHTHTLMLYKHTHIHTLLIQTLDVVLYVYCAHKYTHYLYKLHTHTYTHTTTHTYTHTHTDALLYVYCGKHITRMSRLIGMLSVIKSIATLPHMSYV
jgi:hypothetical protein